MALAAMGSITFGGEKGRWIDTKCFPWGFFIFCLQIMLRTLEVLKNTKNFWHLKRYNHFFQPEWLWPLWEASLLEVKQVGELEQNASHGGFSYFALNGFSTFSMRNHVFTTKTNAFSTFLPPRVLPNFNFFLNFLMFLTFNLPARLFITCGSFLGTPFFLRRGFLLGAAFS